MLKVSWRFGGTFRRLHLQGRNVKRVASRHWLAGLYSVICWLSCSCLLLVRWGLCESQWVLAVRSVLRASSSCLPFPSCFLYNPKFLVLGFATWFYAGFLAYSSTLKMEATCSSETSLKFQRTSRLYWYIPEHRTVQTNSVSRVHLAWLVYPFAPKRESTFSVSSGNIYQTTLRQIAEGSTRIRRMALKTT
jgi:hypothetical protein